MAQRGHNATLYYIGLLDLAWKGSRNSSEGYCNILDKYCVDSWQNEQNHRQKSTGSEDISQAKISWTYHREKYHRQKSTGSEDTS